MTSQTLASVPVPVREAPASSALAPGAPTVTHPDVAAKAHPEPKLEVRSIQGNIFPGFLKDHQTMLFLVIDDVAACRRWLRALLPVIATADEVLAFNRLFKAIRSRRGRDSGAVKATWVNIAFAHAALARLTAGTKGDLAKGDFSDKAFRDGLAARSTDLGDPTDSNAEGHPDNWLVGGTHNAVDIVLIAAADDADDLFAQVEELEETIYAFRPGGHRASSGVRVIFKQQGNNLTGALSGHEQFGWLDGVSQPGIRGFVSNNPADVLTPRQNPRDENQGKPGQDLLWPGEFVFGYPYQDPGKPVEQPSDATSHTVDVFGAGTIHQGATADAGPTWARNGSFLVFRRLRQDVNLFHRFLHERALANGLSPSLLGAKVVGRWQVGAPILRAPTASSAALGTDDCANNDFEFFKASPAGGPAPVGDQCGPAIPPTSPGDQPELICPAMGHIRKAYPRDDITPAGASGGTPDEKSTLSEQNTQTHRLLRRGIPFGPASISTPDAPFDDQEDRGLLFLAYQTSILGQFEFVTRAWVNNPNFKDDAAPGPASGFDLIIGQNSAGPTRVATLKLPGKPAVTLSTDDQWVIPTGGGYFFAPSLDALKDVLSSA